MGKPVFRNASIHTWGTDAPYLNVTLQINGKRVEISDMPVSNELMKEMVATFKRYLPKQEDI